VRGEPSVGHDPTSWSQCSASIPSSRSDHVVIKAEEEASAGQPSGMGRMTRSGSAATTDSRSCRLIPPVVTPRDVQFTPHAQHRTSMVSGETDGMQAFMDGKMRVEGDMMLSQKLSELFPA
jgi:hypothetical protein